MRAWLAWWVALAALYLLLADSVVVPELVTGAVAAALGATAATLVRRGRPTAWPRARWLVAAVRPLIGVFGDVGPLARVLVVRGILRRPGAGALVEVAFRATSDEPDDVAHRALTQALGSLAPNTVVVDIDKEHGVLIAHQLSLTADAASRATPLP